MALLDLVPPAFPADWPVIVLTDRGLYARWRYRAIGGHGGQPVRRVNSQGTLHPSGSERRPRSAAFVPPLGSGWAGQGVAFTGADRRLPCTLLACGEAGYTDPWRIRTDRHPSACSIAWYGVRTWIEHDFRTHTRGFWQWQPPPMPDPARAERVWLPLALCTFKLRALGDAIE